MTNIYAACNDLNGYAKVDLDPTVISFYSGEAGSSKEAGTGKPLFRGFPYFATLSLPALDDLE